MEQRPGGASPEPRGAGAGGSDDAARSNGGGGSNGPGGSNEGGSAVAPWEVPIGERPKARDFAALVVGATGYVGRALVDELVRRASVERGIERVVAHVRPGSPRADALRRRLAGRAGASVVECALEADALEDALRAEEITHVFLCHGTTAARAKAEGIDDPYEAVDVGITRAACEAAARLAVAPRVVQLSSVGAKASSRSAYLAARGRAEEVVRSSGAPFTICRAPLISGPGRDERRPGETLARTVLTPVLRLVRLLGLKKLAGRYLPMNAEEAAEGLARSGFHYMTINRVVRSDELRRVGVYEQESWTPRSRRDAGRH
ncbi:MAG: NAD-dependent epimerase/dehydratase family protein [Planctomycetota bacterium]